MSGKRQFKVMAPLATQRAGAHVRFRGRWLCDAGFHPGMSFSVINPSPGVLELRVEGPAQLVGDDFARVLAGFQRVGV